MQQERGWSWRTYSSLQEKITALMMHDELKKLQQHAEEKFNKQQMKTRQLAVDLAARAYELDKGKPPASIANLVPEYLQAIPQDPFTGTNLVYSP
jgi:hypothetical protein